MGSSEKLPLWKLPRGFNSSTAAAIRIDAQNAGPGRRAPGCSLLIRLESRGWISANWGTSTNNRRARFYTLTRSGRKQLVAETTKWRRLAAAIGRVLGPETES